MLQVEASILMRFIPHGKLGTNLPARATCRGGDKSLQSLRVGIDRRQQGAVRCVHPPRTRSERHHNSCVLRDGVTPHLTSNMSEADEVARLKAELASLQQETAALEKKPKKKKSKKEKKKRKTTEDDEAAKLRAELAAVDAETAALTGAPPP